NPQVLSRDAIQACCMSRSLLTCSSSSFVVNCRKLALRMSSQTARSRSAQAITSDGFIEPSFFEHGSEIRPMHFSQFQCLPVLALMHFSIAAESFAAGLSCA